MVALWRGRATVYDAKAINQYTDLIMIDHYLILATLNLILAAARLKLAVESTHLT